MTGTEPVRTAILTDTRASAAIAARRYGVPPTMIAAAARRRAVGDWRGACAAADVDVYVNPDAVRRRYGAETAGRLLTGLRELSPDLLRWHLPRRAHGAGELLAGLFVPIAEFDADGRVLSLVAMTPRSALEAGQRIVLTVLENGVRPRPVVAGDPVVRALLESLHLKHAARHSLVRHPMFWSAERASDLAVTRDVSAEAQEIVRLQDAGSFAAAWQLAGFSFAVDDTLPSRARWLAGLPVRLPGLADRIRAAVPGVDAAVLRSGPGALVLSGLTSAAGSVVVSDADGRGLAAVPTAVWARPVDVDLLRCGLLGGHELHPLIASAFGEPEPAADESDESDDWLYREVPFIAGRRAGGGIPTLWIQCGAATHRVVHHKGTWRSIDHLGAAHRESVLRRLGGPGNPCRQAADYLASGRHVIDLAESLLQHGRADDVRHLLHTHAGAQAALDEIDLPAGGTVGEALATLRENTLRLRMLLAGAVRPRDTRSSLALPTIGSRRTRLEVPARTHR
ncbi:MAG: hypothetical protein HOW97_28545 [Catenulispora sp.]|nr:hypothetical protein [Catenulispora sp.]